MRPSRRQFLLPASLAFAVSLALAQDAEFALAPAAQVGSDGVFLHQLLAGEHDDLPRDIRISDPPAFGRTGVLRRDQILARIPSSLRDAGLTNLGGPALVVVGRRSRELGETELVNSLTRILQRDVVRERGELELRLGRPWRAVAVPDEPFEVCLLDVPPNGLSQAAVVRFELRTRTETIGSWQAVLQARIMREVWTTRTAIKRGQSVTSGDLVRERRDVMNVREPLAEFDHVEGDLEAADYVPAGAPVLARAFRSKAAIRRGQFVEALVQEGSMRISMRVEVLEDGAAGELVRLRNPISRKELKGKVHDEHTVVVCF